MKVCPQCSSVFSDDFVYCSNDGSVLAEENLPFPTDADAEAETVIRRRGEPIVVDFNQPSQTQAETVEMNYDNLPRAAQTPIVVEKTSSSKFYALFLLVGLLLGGGLVLATLLAARFINRPGDPANVVLQDNRNGNKTASPTPETANTERDNEVDKIANELHTVRDSTRLDEDFNGRVIVENANVRSAPNNNATQVDILPNGDRLTIERRAGEASPWYYVTCEHGVSGWMHGNTIEFTNGNF